MMEMDHGFGDWTNTSHLFKLARSKWSPSMSRSALRQLIDHLFHGTNTYCMHQAIKYSDEAGYAQHSPTIIFS